MMNKIIKSSLLLILLSSNVISAEKEKIIDNNSPCYNKEGSNNLSEDKLRDHVKDIMDLLDESEIIGENKNEYSCESSDSESDEEYRLLLIQWTRQLMREQLKKKKEFDDTDSAILYNYAYHYRSKESKEEEQK